MTLRDLRAQAKRLGIIGWNQYDRETLETMVSVFSRMEAETQKVNAARREARQ